MCEFPQTENHRMLDLMESHIIFEGLGPGGQINIVGKWISARNSMWAPVQYGGPGGQEGQWYPECSRRSTSSRLREVTLPLYSALVKLTGVLCPVLGKRDMEFLERVQ